MRRLLTCALTVGTLAMPAAAWAQTTSERPTFVTFGVGGQFTNADISTTEMFTLFQETATISSDVTIGGGARVDVGGGRWITRRLGAGVRFSLFQKTGTLTADYALPYPFLFSEHRRASIDAEATQQVRDLHLQALWRLRETGPWSIIVFGGPSITWLSQDLTNSAVDVSYAFPFDEIELSAGTGVRPDGRAVGAHAGLALSRRLTPRLALDGELRWHHATVDLDDDGTPVSVEVGGLQAVVGFRFAF